MGPRKLSECCRRQVWHTVAHNNRGSFGTSSPGSWSTWTVLGGVAQQGLVNARDLLGGLPAASGRPKVAELSPRLWHNSRRQRMSILTQPVTCGVRDISAEDVVEPAVGNERFD
jgi:hypothetical protein